MFLSITNLLQMPSGLDHYRLATDMVKQTNPPLTICGVNTAQLYFTRSVKDLDHLTREIGDTCKIMVTTHLPPLA